MEGRERARAVSVPTTDDAAVPCGRPSSGGCEHAGCDPEADGGIGRRVAVHLERHGQLLELLLLLEHPLDVGGGRHPRPMRKSLAALRMTASVVAGEASGGLHLEEDERRLDGDALDGGLSAPW